MNLRLGFKDLGFIIEALINLKNSYKKKYLETSDENELSDLGNDIKFIESLNNYLINVLEQNKQRNQENLTEFLQNEGFYNMTSEERDEVLELEEIEVDGSAKTFIYKDAEKKKSLFERIKNALSKL